MERLTARIKNNPAVPAKFDLDFVLGSNIDDTTWKCLDALIQRLAAYEDTGLEPDEIPHWIPISEKLPQRNEWVLAYQPKSKDEAATIEISRGFMFPLKTCKYTHWMPLPQPPKGAK